MTETAKRALQTAAACVAVAAVAFAAGRFSAPLEVEERESVRVVYRDRVVTVKGKTETRVVYRDRVITPDGTTREQELERTATREDLERTATREGERERVVEKVVTVRPDWRVGVLAGASVRDPLVTLSGPLVLGVQVDRRIAGGVSAGVWVNTVGAGGLSLSLEF